jgi:glycerophosphoryl diester phosphodiesterase
MALIALVCACGVGASRGPGPGASAGPSARGVEATHETTVVNVGHRGASGHAPEHTLPAYDLALRHGADYIEQDLQLTSDGVLVVLHDPTLDRTARGPAEDCTGPVIEKTLAQVKRCDVGSWFNDRYPEHARPEYVGLRVPTLEEVFQRYGRGTRYYIETKNPEEAPGMEEALLRLIDAHGLLGPAAERRQVLVQSFSAWSLRRLHALAPSLPLVQLFGSTASTSELIRPALADVATYAVGIGPSKAAVDAALVEAAHARCLDVHPYTVDEASEMQALLALGVDGMFTNFPDRLDALLRRDTDPAKRSARRAATEGTACRAGR